ncbi:MAG: hypothetical protein WAZ12_01730 [Candidatus Absconditicoccaceae bacterium]
MENVLIFIAAMDKVFFYAFLVSFIMLFVTMIIYSYQDQAKEESYNSNVVSITYLEWCMAGWISAVTALWGCLLITLLIGVLI